MGKLNSVMKSFVSISKQLLNSIDFEIDFDENAENSLGDNEEALTNLGKVLMSEGPDLMQFWNDKIMLSMGKHTLNSNTFSKSSKNAMSSQIEGVLADRQRLLKRTRTKRVEYLSSEPSKEISDNEIYDEYDFYQSLVKDLIANRSSATGQFLSNQSDAAMKLKSVKSITTQLARKHKSIVYDIHAKLIGYTS